MDYIPIKRDGVVEATVCANLQPSSIGLEQIENTSMPDFLGLPQIPVLHHPINALLLQRLLDLHSFMLHNWWE